MTGEAPAEDGADDPPGGPPGSNTVEGAMTPADIEKMRFDYAWKWFAFHAEQRTKMLNYMLIALGLLATATTTLVSQKFYFGAGLVATVGFVTALVFVLLDYRNKVLLRKGEDKLRDLEERVLFNAPDRPYAPGASPTGILWNEPPANAGSGSQGLFAMALAGKHRFWFPAIGILLSAAYFAAAVYLLCTGYHTPDPPAPPAAHIVVDGQPVRVQITDPGNSASSASGWGASACAAPSPRSDGCARASR